MMELVIAPTGHVQCIYDETIDLSALGRLTIRRASRVEPSSEGKWFADLMVMNGPILGPFESRSHALAAEHAWLLDHWLPS